MIEHLDRCDISKLNDCSYNDVLHSCYDYDELSLQELLCQFFKKINDCIDDVNKYSELVKNLLTWIEQEGLEKEVVKLLTKWKDDGILRDIITDQVLVEISNRIKKRVKYYSNYNEMASDIKLENGMSCITQGYYLPNDGGGAEYVKQLDQIKQVFKFTVTPEMFGAKGDGSTDDRPSIQKAIDFIKDNKGGELCFIQGKTYMLKSFTDSPGKNILNVYSNITIRGNALIKLGEAFGDYKTVFAQSGVLNNVVIKDITIDENSRNNPWTSGVSGKDLTHRSCIFFYGSDQNKNILIDNITIKDTTGVWAISAWGDNINFKNITIIYGDSEVVADRTALYNSSTNSFVENCTVIGKPCLNAGFESHNSNQYYYNNNLIDINVGMYIQNENKIEGSVDIKNNTFKILKEAITFWTHDNSVKLTDVNISGNTIDFIGKSLTTQGLISNYPILKSSTILRVNVTNNIFNNNSSFKVGSAVEFQGGGGTVIDVYNVANNILNGSFDKGFFFANQNGDEPSFTINKINVVNNIANDDMDVLFRSIVSPTMKDFNITNNTVLGNVQYGANFYGKSSNCYIRYGNNKFKLVAQASELTKANEIKPDIDNLDLKVPFVMENAPYVGQWKKGQIVYNSNVAVGQPIGWVCTTGGNTYDDGRIEFKPFGKIEES